MRRAIYFTLMLAILALAHGADGARAADARVPDPSIRQMCTDQTCRHHEHIYADREYFRVRYPKCRRRDACSLYGAYGPYGGAPFWGAYTGWGVYQVW